MKKAKFIQEMRSGKTTAADRMVNALEEIAWQLSKIKSE